MTSKEVIIAVRGGVATVVEQPDGVGVHIKDYDINGIFGINIQVDEDGDEFVFACDCCS